MCVRLTWSCVGLNMKHDGERHGPQPAALHPASLSRLGSTGVTAETEHGILLTTILSVAAATGAAVIEFCDGCYSLSGSGDTMLGATKLDDAKLDAICRARQWATLLAWLVRSRRRRSTVINGLLVIAAS